MTKKVIEGPVEVRGKFYWVVKNTWPGPAGSTHTVTDLIPVDDLERVQELERDNCLSSE